MIFEIPKFEVKALLEKQLQCFFPLTQQDYEQIDSSFDAVLKRCETNFYRNPNRYFHSDDHNGEAFFSPFHSGQWTIFLYYFSHYLYKHRDFNGGGSLKDKLFYLNKIMNGIDVFYDVELPDFFTLNHQVGTVLGRGKYSDGFSFIQDCTVGESYGQWPTIGENCCMCAGSSIIGNAVIGDNVLIGAGATIKNDTIPSNVLVFGESPNLIIKKKKNLAPFYW